MLTKEQAIKKYKLEPLTPEGGYFRRIYESEPMNAASRRYAASIYYMLEAPDFSCFHRIDCDELWHFLGGTEMVLYQILPDGQLTETVLGDALSDEAVMPFALIKKGTWFAARIKNNNGFGLVGCTTIPEFLYHTFEAGTAAGLNKLFPQHSELITELTRR